MRRSSARRAASALVALAALAACTDLGDEISLGPAPDDSGDGDDGTDDGGNGGPVAVTDTVVLPPCADATLYEDPQQLSNGAGSYLQVGTNNAGSFIRRALLAFPIADSIPVGVTVDEAQLTILVSTAKSNTPRTTRLHRVQQRWGEGSVNADGTGGGGGGGGAPASLGDATWTHAVLDTMAWSSPGGDFQGAGAGSTSLGGVGQYTFATSAEAVACVQGWLDAPASNFGWILVGDESAPGTGKRIDSRENAMDANRPRLRVIYTDSTAARRPVVAAERSR